MVKARVWQQMAVAVAAIAAPVAGQLAPHTTPPLQRLDPGVSDVDPLSMSLRDMQVDLRQPMGFQHVYRAPGHDDLYMRVSGGIYAVFPQSVYARTRYGPAPLIPAGTVFFVGPPSWLQPKQPGNAEPPPNPARVRARIETRLSDEADLAGVSNAGGIATGMARSDRLPIVETLSPGPRIVSDDGYRAQRIEELLGNAVRASRASNR